MAVSGAAVLGGINPTHALGVDDTERAFSFVHLTDTHVGSRAGNQNTPACLADIKERYPWVSFVINSGDIAEFGSAEQYDTYQQMISGFFAPIHHCPGNHESRWGDNGKGHFRERFGKTYYSFDFKGWRFVILDTSIHGQTHGHLEAKMLTWLENDLKETSLPVMVFCHHPVGYERTRFLDNDDDLFAVLKGRNVKAIFTGHGHSNLEWKVDGIPCFMTQAGMELGYKYIEVDAKEVRIYNRVLGEQADAWEVMRFPVGGMMPGTGGVTQSTAGSDFVKIHIQSPVAGSRYTTSEGGLALAGRFEGQVANLQWQLGLKPWQVVQKKADGSFNQVIDISGYEDGFYTLRVRAVDPKGGLWLERLEFYLERGQVVPIWSFQASGGVLGNPVVIGDTLFIGDTGGSLYALSTETGQVRWSYAAESEIVASPAYLGFQTLSARGTTPLPGFLAAQALLPVPPNTPGVGGLVFGTVSGRVICLDAFDGQTRWQYGAGSPVTGAMQGKNGIVVFGTANGLLHALDAYTGKLRWVFQAGGLIKSRPAIGEGMVFATAWDKKVYAVDLATGQLRWTVELARSVYYSAAESNPLYHRGVVYLCTKDKRVHCLKAKDGSVVWSVDESAGMSSAQLKGDSLLLHSMDGGLFTLKPETGEKTWAIQTGRPNYTSLPVIGRQRIYMGSLGGGVVAVEAADEGKRLVFSLGESYIFASAATDGQTVFAANSAGRICALRFR